MKRLSLILFILIINLTNAQIERKSDNLEIWTFSIGNFIQLNAEKIIEKKYPFKIVGVAGDAITEELIDSVKIHNRKIWNYLDSNGYSISKTTFESDLESEISRIKLAIAISQSNEIISKLLSDLSERNLQNYTELNKINDEIYEFRIYSFDLKNIDKEQLFEMKFTSDLKHNKIDIAE
jgi:hypothetical protein